MITIWFQNVVLTLQWCNNDVIFDILRQFDVLFKGLDLSNQIKLRLDFQTPTYFIWNLLRNSRMSSVLSNNVFWRHSDVIMTSVLPFLLYFAAKIVKASIQIVWTWPMPFLTCFQWEKTKCLLFFKFDVIMTLLWRHFYHFFIGNHKIIN